jgi:putative MFS transporter
LIVAGFYHDAFIGGVSVFFLMLLAQGFFNNGGYAVVGPYSAEVWPATLRGSGMGFGYGLGNFGKIIGPLGLALIVGSSDIVGGAKNGRCSTARPRCQCTRRRRAQSTGR